jgi:hypothetical protein
MYVHMHTRYVEKRAYYLILDRGGNEICRMRVVICASSILFNFYCIKSNYIYIHSQARTRAHTNMYVLRVSLLCYYSFIFNTYVIISARLKKLTRTYRSYARIAHVYIYVYASVQTGYVTRVYITKDISRQKFSYTLFLFFTRRLFLRLARWCGNLGIRAAGASGILGRADFSGKFVP